MSFSSTPSLSRRRIRCRTDQYQVSNQMTLWPAACLRLGVRPVGTNGHSICHGRIRQPFVNDLALSMSIC